MIQSGNTTISQFDILVGKLKTAISATQKDNVPIVIEFNEGIDPFPNTQFLFIIGTEQVLCVGKTDDTHYTINRDPFNKGLKLSTHAINEDIYFIPIGSAILRSSQSSDSLLENDSFRYLDEMLYSSLGKKNVVDIFGGAYSSYFTPSISVSGGTVKVTMSPGFLFVVSSSGIIKSLIISGNESLKSNNYVNLSLDDIQENEIAYIYVKNDATFVCSLGNIPTDVFVDSSGNNYKLCSLTYNEEVPNSITFEDLRPESLLSNVNQENFIDADRIVGTLPVELIEDGSIEKVKINSSSTKNWDDAFSWGDHSKADYLSDTSPAGSVTQQLISNWNNVFQWGDHSLSNYLVDPSVENTVEGQVLTKTASGYEWKDLFNYGNGSISRNGQGLITGISIEGSSISFTRDEGGSITTMTDSKRTWTLSRNNDLQLISWTVENNN